MAKASKTGKDKAAVPAKKSTEKASSEPKTQAAVNAGAQEQQTGPTTVIPGPDIMGDAKTVIPETGVGGQAAEQEPRPEPAKEYYGGPADRVMMPVMGFPVCYFPEGSNRKLFDNVISVPAIVQTESMEPTLNVFTGHSSQPIIVFKSVPHESKKEAGQHFWKWPEMFHGQ